MVSDSAKQGTNMTQTPRPILKVANRAAIKTNTKLSRKNAKVFGDSAKTAAQTAAKTAAKNTVKTTSVEPAASGSDENRRRARPFQDSQRGERRRNTADAGATDEKRQRGFGAERKAPPRTTNREGGFRRTRDESTEQRTERSAPRTGSREGGFSRSRDGAGEQRTARTNRQGGFNGEGGFRRTRDESTEQRTERSAPRTGSREGGFSRSRDGAGSPRTVNREAGFERKGGFARSRDDSTDQQRRRTISTGPDANRNTESSEFKLPPRTPRSTPSEPQVVREPRAAAPRLDETGLMRLSKRMSELGLCSRREADEWIERGLVRVNGEVVDTLGAKVSPEDEVTIDSKASREKAKRVTVLIHKPMGYVSGQAEDGHIPAFTLVNAESQWEGDRSGVKFHHSHLKYLVPAGRLDIDSTGLLVLTQDGTVAKILIGEDSKIEKEYLVRVEYGDSREGRPSQLLPAADLKRLQHGLVLDGVQLKPAKVSWQNEDQLRFVLREGRKRQIRRMCELVGLKVVGLKRIRIGSVTLSDLPVGQWRFLAPDEKF
jgi:23S rRNA pseudouridine2604 synthase